LATKKLTNTTATAGEIQTAAASQKAVKKTVEKREKAAKNGQAVVKKATTSTSVPKKTTKKTDPVSEKKPAAKKAVPVKAPVSKTGLQKIIFQINFHTQLGQQLFITGDHPLLGNDETEQAVPLQYFNEEYWYLVLDLGAADIVDRDIQYHYLLKNADGILNYDWGNDKTINPAKINAEELLVTDSWNYAGYFENTFYTEPFAQVLLKANHTAVKSS
jgi:4-alpha-glucanotransferase